MVALARSAQQYAYPYEQVWPATLRFLRIDEGMKITEKDVDAGYIVFEVTSDKKTFEGTAELVKGKDPKGRAATKVILKIKDRPSYMEQGILDRFEQKLREDLGPPEDPPPPPPPPAPAPEKDKK